MFLLRPSILAASMLSCTHLHFISSYVLSLLYMFKTPKPFQLRPWPQICTPILTAATLYCMHLHFISPMSCLCFEGLRNPNSSGRGGRRNTPTAVKWNKPSSELLGVAPWLWKSPSESLESWMSLGAAPSPHNSGSAHSEKGKQWTQYEKLACA